MCLILNLLNMILILILLINNSEIVSGQLSHGFNNPIYNKPYTKSTKTKLSVTSNNNIVRHENASSSISNSTTNGPALIITQRSDSNAYIRVFAKVVPSNRKKTIVTNTKFNFFTTPAIRRRQDEVETTVETTVATTRVKGQHKNNEYEYEEERSAAGKKETDNHAETTSEEPQETSPESTDEEEETTEEMQPAICETIDVDRHPRIRHYFHEPRCYSGNNDTFILVKMNKYCYTIVFERMTRLHEEHIGNTVFVSAKARVMWVKNMTLGTSISKKFDFMDDCKKLKMDYSNYRHVACSRCGLDLCNNPTPFLKRCYSCVNCYDCTADEENAESEIDSVVSPGACMVEIGKYWDNALGLWKIYNMRNSSYENIQECYLRKSNPNFANVRCIECDGDLCNGEAIGDLKGLYKYYYSLFGRKRSEFIIPHK